MSISAVKKAHFDIPSSNLGTLISTLCRIAVGNKQMTPYIIVAQKTMTGVDFLALCYDIGGTSPYVLQLIHGYEDLFPAKWEDGILRCMAVRTPASCFTVLLNFSSTMLLSASFILDEGIK